MVTVCALTEQISVQNLKRLMKSFSIDNALKQKKSCISQLTLSNRPIKTNININENAQDNHPRRKKESEAVQEHSCKQRKQEHAVVVSGLKSYYELDPTRAQKNDLLNELDGTKITQTRVEVHNEGVGFKRSKIFLAPTREPCDLTTVNEKGGFLTLRDHDQTFTTLSR